MFLDEFDGHLPIPSAYRILAKKRQVQVCLIEPVHDLECRLSKWLYLWCECDAVSWGMRLWLFDGKQFREVDLMERYYVYLCRLHE